MLENCKTAQERWGGVSDIIDRWLGERQKLLVQFCNLSEIAEDTSNDLRGPALRTLCQMIVDYVSAGHFEVYNELIKEAEEFEDTKAISHSRSAFESIDATTEIILDFNDKYQEVDDLETLVSDLSSLGETMATRIEAEDGIIAIMHTAHKDQVA